MTTVVAEQERPEELPEGWSAKGESEMVLRLFRGEAVDDVSRQIQVPVHELEAWRRACAIKQAQGGELMMKLELAEMLLEKKGLRGGADGAQEAARLVSPSTGRRYPLTMVCAVWRGPRSTVYARFSASARSSDAPEGPETPDQEGGDLWLLPIWPASAIRGRCSPMPRWSSPCGRS